jgi:hypothetical protein
MVWVVLVIVVVGGTLLAHRRGTPEAADRLSAVVGNLFASMGPGFSERASYRALQRRVLTGALRLRTISVNGVVRIPGTLDVALAPEDEPTVRAAASTFLSDIGSALAIRAKRAGWQVDGDVDLRFVGDTEVEPGRPLVTRRARPDDRAEEVVPRGRAKPAPAVTLAFASTQSGYEPTRSYLAGASAPARAALVLRPVRDGLEPIRIRPDGEPVVVGRRAEAGRRADVDSVSARHCRFEFDGHGWRVADLDSKNGTFVNGVRISGPQRVRRGDVLQLGPAAVYRCT